MTPTPLLRQVRARAKGCHPKYLALLFFFLLFSLGAALLRRDLFSNSATSSYLSHTTYDTLIMSVTTQTYPQRAAKHVNPTAKRLLEIMERKQSNLCVSVDVTTAQEALEVVRRVGKSVCMVKVSATLICTPCSSYLSTAELRPIRCG